MAYLDIHNEEDFTHLLQLFLHAHPADKALSDEARTELDQPDEHFLSPRGIEALARWGRERHLLPRHQAAQLLRFAQQLLARPEDVITLVPSVMGAPPRRQLGVRGSEIYTWVYCRKVSPMETDAVFSLPAAVTICRNVEADPESTELTRSRAAALAAWLQAQGDGDATSTDV